ncbi:MAG: metallophosphoesterase [Candidatus Woesearchaeota archaeon]|nr:MAG: metallophosphoesterase [Candidatus Woesearchaeota archaeon]
MEKKLRILAAGDLHGNIAQVELLAKKAEEENVDLVILTGDITHFDRSSENLIGPFVKKGKKVFLVPGNHESLETISLLTEIYGIKSLHGAYYILGDIALFGCGGITQRVGPVLTLTEAEVERLLERSHEKIKGSKKKIMVTHEHPAGCIIDRIIPNSGSKSIRKAVDRFQPDLVLCGHIHEAWGIEDRIGKTRIVNVGRDGTILEI